MQEKTYCKYSSFWSPFLTALPIEDIYIIVKAIGTNACGMNKRLLSFIMSF